MSWVYSGLPVAGEHTLHLPHRLRSVLVFPNALALLTEDGRLLLHEDGKISALEVDPPLPPIRAIYRCGTKTLARKILCLLENGKVFQVLLDSLPDVIERENPGGADGQLRFLVNRSQHQIWAGTSAGQVWSKGSIPLTGLVHNAEHPEKVSFFSGQEIVQLEAGLDFNICIVRSNELLVSPDQESLPSLTEPDEHCPLGLSLKDLNTDLNQNIHKDETDGCDATREKSPQRRAILTNVPQSPQLDCAGGSNTNSNQSSDKEESLSDTLLLYLEEEDEHSAVKNIVLRILILSVKRSSHGQLRKKEHFKSQALSTYFLVMSEVV